MHSTTVVASVLAFAATAFAQTAGFAVISAPGKSEQVPSGETYTIEWSAGSFTGPVTIALIGGKDPATLVPVQTISAGVDVTDESFAWDVACSLGTDATYGLQITSENAKDTFQWSFPFQITAPSCKTDDSSHGYPTGYPVISTTTSSSSSSSISLSSYPVSTPVSTTSSAYPITTEESSSSVYVTTSYAVNTTFTTSKATASTTATPVVITTKSTQAVTPSSVPTPSQVPQGAAAKSAAGSFALLAGVAAAVLAL